MPSPAFPRANKRLGQHFLIDQNIVRKIVAAAELTPDETVLEVGPGRGILTEALASVARRVVAVEIDPQLHRLLQARQSEWKNEIGRASCRERAWTSGGAGAGR